MFGYNIKFSGLTNKEPLGELAFSSWVKGLKNQRQFVFSPRLYHQTVDYFRWNLRLYDKEVVRDGGTFFQVGGRGGGGGGLTNDLK